MGTRSDLPCRDAPPELVVFDELTRCPYLPGQVARLPLRYPARGLQPQEFAERLATGDRRQGVLLYRPACPTCQACEALRIDVQAFRPSKTQRRILRRGDALVETTIDRPRLTDERVDLYNRHKIERGLLTTDGFIEADGYEQFLVETCTDSFELTYRLNGRLIGIAITDRAADALSAVYCFYDPAYAHLSPGVYSILKQWELCRTWRLPYLYLGLYVAGCTAMEYKASYLPHERLIAGRWVRFDAASSRLPTP